MSRQGGAAIVLGLFLAVALSTRIALLVKAAHVLDWDLSIIGAFFVGLVFDLGAGLILAAPVALFLGVLPSRFFAWRWARIAAHVMLAAVLCVFLFGAVGEWFFWDEFGCRFNFIAVDYLIYTKEVVDNIRESYPMPAIIAGLLGGSALLTWLLARSGLVSRWLDAPAGPMRHRWLVTAVWMGAMVLGVATLDVRRAPAFANTYNGEIARNGLWSLFAAFRNNELNYSQFYATLPVDDAFGVMRRKMMKNGDRPLFPSDTRDTLRFVSNPAPEIYPNVIQITVESLSAKFLGEFSRASNARPSLTPNLDALIPQSLFFENFYATGNRTDRGMEALSLSLPPTPGRSLIKRPANAGLFTLGSVFRSRNYDTAFIYGGYGYFDNMNAFFGGNGYRVIDRASVGRDDITFANAWGACDEDLLRWTLREADESAASGRPFHYFVMTTSNHRPFTYPEGRIDLPSKTSGRPGGVKYTDYAIGEFLRQAANRPWYKNTIFVIVADHCAGSAGRTALPMQNYRIPLIVYAPGGQISPGRVAQLTSQIDYAPTLLGLLGWSYASRFYGQDVLKTDGGQRALVGNYQKLGFYEDGHLTVLSPLRGVEQFTYDPATAAQASESVDIARKKEAIAYYQTASWMYQHGRYRGVSPEEQARWRREQSGEGKRPASEASVATINIVP